MVSNLPTEEPAGDADIPRNSEGLELLWSGVSQSLSDRIHDALDAANIFHNVTEKDFGLLPNLTQTVKFTWINSRDRASSRSVLEKTLVDWDATEREADLTPPDVGRMNPFGLGRKVSPKPERRDAPFESVSLLESDARGEPVPDDISEEIKSADATFQVWSGEAETAETFGLCLGENGIPCAIDVLGGTAKVRVLPEHEARAKEIIREVIEATPPG